MVGRRFESGPITQNKLFDGLLALIPPVFNWNVATIMTFCLDFIEVDSSSWPQCLGVVNYHRVDTNDPLGCIDER